MGAALQEMTMPGDPLSHPLIEIAHDLREKRITAQELVETAIRLSRPVISAGFAADARHPSDRDRGKPAAPARKPGSTGG